MRLAVLYLIGSAALLVAAAAWPRDGQPVLIALPPGAPLAQGFAAADWRILRVVQAGPVALLHAAPESASARTVALRRATGAAFVIAAPAVAGCGPVTRKDS